MSRDANQRVEDDPEPDWAESFGERVLRCAGHVLTEGNTLLADDELEMLVVLRMNYKFMRFMRKHYNHLTKDSFGQSVVKAESE